jgi:hypothetical protein
VDSLEHADDGGSQKNIEEECGEYGNENIHD